MATTDRGEATLDVQEKSWIGSAKLIGFCTLLSRLLGFLRDVIMAAFFGTGVAMDAFVLAFMVPNLFRRLFGEGAVSAAFVPVFTDHYRQKDRAAAERFFRACFTVLASLLGGICLVVWAGCLIARIYGTEDPTWRAFVPLLEILFPYMPLICLAALAGAALNVRRHFLMPALAPVVLNLCWIAGLVFGAARFGIFAVAWVILAGGAIQLAMMLLTLPRYGVRPGLRWEPDHEGLRRVSRMVVPMLFGLAVTQINIVVDGLIAKFCVPGTGANSALYYGNRLVQFPLGVFGAALATAIFPTLASRAKENDREGLMATVRQGLRVALFVALPATAIAIALRSPIVAVVFERGRFDETSAARTSVVLMFYAAGLAAYCANQIIARAFYALEDARTPVKVAAYMVGLNFTLNITLVWFLREAGLALATAVCAFVNVGILVWILQRRLGGFEFGDVVRSGLKSLLASAACGGAAYGVDSLLAGRSAIVRCGLAFPAGALVFVAVAWVLRMEERTEVIGRIRKRSAKGK